MAKGRINVLRAIPGSTFLAPLLRDFARQPFGVVTAFSDSLLPFCRQLLGDGSAVEVLPFGEIVRNLLLLCGEEVMPLAQSGHKRAAIAYACTLVGDDSPFRKANRFEGFHEAVESDLEELRNWRIFADTMDELAEQASPRLAAKLRTLSQIDREVSQILESLGRQRHTDHLEACFEALPELEGDLDRLLVIVGSDESPLRIEWLKWLAGHGVDITVIFDRHATDAPIFLGAKHSMEILGVKPKDMGDGNVLMRNLFAGASFGGAPVSVTKASAADPLAEAEWALRGCIEDGHPEQTGLYVRDLESYAPLIESAAKRFGVPIRMARRAPLLTNSFARLTLSALQFCASNDVRTLSSIVRSSYLRLSGPQQNGLDTLLRQCYVQKGAQWQALELWVAEHAAENEWLTVLLEWRRKTTEGEHRLHEWYSLTKELNREQRLPWVTIENKGGKMDERDRRALNQMERLLANHISVDDVTRASSVSFAEFVRLCERLWTTGDVSIPTAENGVQVSSDPYALGEVDRLRVLGMLEGVFPRRRSEDPILTDAERAEISSSRPGHPPLPDSRTVAQAERDEFYRVCAIAKKSVVFSYPQADDQKDNIPAFYLTEVERAAGSIVTLDHPRAELTPLIEACMTGADLRLRIAADGAREHALPVEIVSATAREAIQPPPGAAFQPSVLRDVLQCPFRYLVRHVLHVRVKRQSERWGSLRKLPQVSLLLTSEDLEKAELAMLGALDTTLDQMYADVPEWEMQLLRAGGERLIREWLDRETRSREKWPKTEGSVKASVSFGTHGVRNGMPGNVRLEGSIPGVSKLDNYNVAHLYGSVPATVKELKDPEKLYFGLHLLAIHEPGRESALEIETMTGKRTLLVLGRSQSEPLESSVADGLQVLDLATSDDTSQAKKEFYDQVKRALAEAMRRILEARVDATMGDHCEWCDYGELCRRSRDFGEEESPFGEDLEFEDV